MVWCKQENGHLIKVPLVLKSEWSCIKRDIFDDFEKLLVARTQLRVMIFYQDKTLSVEKVLLRDYTASNLLPYPTIAISFRKISILKFRSMSDSNITIASSCVDALRYGLSLIRAL